MSTDDVGRGVRALQKRSLDINKNVANLKQSMMKPEWPDLLDKSIVVAHQVLNLQSESSKNHHSLREQLHNYVVIPTQPTANPEHVPEFL